MEYPTLYKKTSTGKIQMWRIEVREGDPKARGGVELSGQVYTPARNEAAQIITTYGQLDGKQQITSELISEGKNVGKANETTPHEQAVAEAQSRWEKKSKKSYVQTLEDAEAGTVDTTFITGGVDPMLAHSYEKQGHKIVYPAYTQAKLDGHRCIAIYENGKATLWSRTRKRITGVPHIERQLEALLAYVDFDEPVILDGELYNHDYKDRFEELTSHIRQVTPQPGHEVVQYWIYDIVVDAPFKDRLALIQELEAVKEAHAPEATQIAFTPTTEVENEDELMNLFGIFMDYGFEGAMARNADGLYKNKRSYDLQKIKTFEDSEFLVVAVEEGRGKMAGKAMFVCELPNGETFRVKMVGKLDDLTTMYEEADRYIGEQLTVKYQGLSAYGVPRFPVAMRFREDV